MSLLHILFYLLLSLPLQPLSPGLFPAPLDCLCFIILSYFCLRMAWHYTLLLIPLVAAVDKAWLHPNCNTRVVKAFNEARYASGLLNQALDLEREDNLEFLDDPFDWFFGFKTDDGAHIDYVQERLRAIASIERTFARTDANIRLYCDNMMSWIPDDPGAQAPQTWETTNAQVMNTFFKHETEGVHAFGKNVECRQIGDGTLAATTAFTASRNIQEGSEPIENIIIDLCQLLENDLAATSSDAVTFPLGMFQEVSEMHTIAYTIVHELIHVPRIGGGTVDGHQHPSPSDTHVTSTGETKLGYYINKDDPNGVARLPGKFLGEAHLTITNPDSYMYICMFYRFWAKGWEMQLNEQSGRLIFAWEPPEPGSEDAVDWKDVELPDGQGTVWMWAGTEWPTDQAPNWTDDPTPQDSTAAPPT